MKLKEICFEKSLTDGQTDRKDRQTNRRTDDGHKVMGKDLADLVSWAKNTICQIEMIDTRPNILRFYEIL